ncbi:MAG: hypothetical protein R3F59_13915 [Myxococcota bacterium]
MVDHAEPPPAEPPTEAIALDPDELAGTERAYVAVAAVDRPPPPVTPIPAWPTASGIGFGAIDPSQDSWGSLAKTTELALPVRARRRWGRWLGIGIAVGFIGIGCAGASLLALVAASLLLPGMF